MRSRLFCALAVLAVLIVGAGCEHADRKKMADADCEAAVGGLRSWLAMMEREGKVDPEWIRDPAHDSRYLARPVAPVALVRVDAPSSPLPRAPILTLQRRVVRWDDGVAPLEGLDDLFVKIGGDAALWATGSFSAGATVEEPIVLRIAPDEQWGDVVTLVEAAARHHYGRFFFVFAAPGLAIPPRASAYGEEMRQNAMDNRAPSDGEKANERALLRANASCPKIGAYFVPHPSSSTESDLQEQVFMTSVAGQAASCRCEVDFDAIRAFTWFRMGRHWGPLTSHRELEIGAEKGEKVEVLSAPAETPWREAHRVILGARPPTPGESTPRFALAVR